MRVLFAGAPFIPNTTLLEIDLYNSRGVELVINTHRFTDADMAELKLHISDLRSVAVVSYSLLDPTALLQNIIKDDEGFDAIVFPSDLYCLTAELLQAAVDDKLKRRLRIIGSPNDSAIHLSGVADAANSLNIKIVNTSGVHANSVAEYTLSQFGFYARKLLRFYDVTGQDGAWLHDEAIRLTHDLRGQTLGVIGGSGKDGAAVTKLAVHLGMKVVSTTSGTPEAIKRSEGAGATVVPDLKSLLAPSNFISINSRITKDMFGLISTDEIQMMRRGVGIINPASAEIFNKEALLEEFQKSASERHIGLLVMDMAFGGGRRPNAFDLDPANAVLKKCGVLFTPRIAGYTIESYTRAVVELASVIIGHLDGDQKTLTKTSSDIGTHNGNVNEDSDHKLLVDIGRLVFQAGKEALELRENGLIYYYKDDGSPVSNADLAVEAKVIHGLRQCGYAFAFIGEETQDSIQDDQPLQLVIDGIDGTRNFRDFNYGWCISVAVRRFGEVVIAVVYEPESGVTYSAIRGEGAVLAIRGHAKQLRILHEIPRDFSFSIGSFRVQGSFEKKTGIIEDIKKLGGRQREWGSVALSICAVARGGLGAFIQGNSFPHDHLAALLIAEEAGASITTRQGHLSSGIDVIATHPSLHRRVAEIYGTRVGA